MTSCILSSVLFNATTGARSLTVSLTDGQPLEITTQHLPLMATHRENGSSVSLTLIAATSQYLETDSHLPHLGVIVARAVKSGATGVFPITQSALVGSKFSHGISPFSTRVSLTACTQGDNVILEWVAAKIGHKIQLTSGPMGSYYLGSIGSTFDAPSFTAMINQVLTPSVQALLPTGLLSGVVYLFTHTTNWYLAAVMGSPVGNLLAQAKAAVAQIGLKKSILISTDQAEESQQGKTMPLELFGAFGGSIDPDAVYPYLGFSFGVWRLASAPETSFWSDLFQVSSPLPLITPSPLVTPNPVYLTAPAAKEVRTQIIASFDVAPEFLSTRSSAHYMMGGS